MASWTSANLSNLLPSEVDSLLDDTRDLLDTMRVPLELITSVLEVVKSVFIQLYVFDFVGALRENIENLKESFLASGIYICDMWNYPYRQLLYRTDYGPDATYKELNFNGTEFESTFLADLSNSINDSMDANRPQFQGDVAMLVLVKADPVIENLGLTDGEDTLADAFQGYANSIRTSSRNIKITRLKAMLGKFKDTAELQPSNKVNVRVDRVVDAFNVITQIRPHDLDLIPAPENFDNDESYYEKTTAANLDWENDVVPMLEAIEDTLLNSSYPDWKRTSLQDVFPSLVEVINQVFDPVIDLLKSGEGMQSQIVAFIESIKSKIEELEHLIAKIDDIIDSIERLINITGFHAIYIKSSNGINDVRSKLLSATNLPFTGNSFYAGMALVAGSDVVTVFDSLFSLVAS